MTKPIPDKAEIALEYPDKCYIGTFERSAHLDGAGISLALHRSGDADVRKSVHMHFHYLLFAEILNELARTVSSMPPDDDTHRAALQHAAKALEAALAHRSGSGENSDHADGRVKHARGGRASSKMTPREEVLLLHVLE
jgi:hypothetical protein